MQTFLRLLEAVASLWASFRAYAERRRASAARDALPLLCGCSAASSADSRTIPLSPILTSLRPVTLDGIEGAWMDWRDAQALAAWIDGVETAR